MTKSHPNTAIFSLHGFAEHEDLLSEDNKLELVQGIEKTEMLEKFSGLDLLQG